MNQTLDLDLLDAVTAEACRRLASLTGLPCPTDPGNKLQLPGLLETSIQHALGEAILEALDHGYTDAETDQLCQHQEITP